MLADTFSHSNPHKCIRLWLYQLLRRIPIYLAIYWKYLEFPFNCGYKCIDEAQHSECHSIEGVQRKNRPIYVNLIQNGIYLFIYSLTLAKNGSKVPNGIDYDLSMNVTVWAKSFNLSFLFRECHFLEQIVTAILNLTTVHSLNVWMRFQVDAKTLNYHQNDFSMHEIADHNFPLIINP